MSQQDDLAYDIAVCVHRADIAPDAVTIWGQAPVAVRPLRRLDDGSLRSGLVTLTAGWTSGGALIPSAHQQIAILSGRVQLGEFELSANAFIVVPAGTVMPAITALEDSEFVLIQDAGQSYRSASENDAGPDSLAIIPDMYAIEPFTPVINGEPLHGFERRVLWLDSESGADTRLLRVPGGFRGGGPNWHPVQEEIFCIAGDIQPDATRPMRAGSFLWNPARSVHGFDEFTHGGCVLLEWHDGAWDLIRA